MFEKTYRFIDFCASKIQWGKERQYFESLYKEAEAELREIKTRFGGLEEWKKK